MVSYSEYINIFVITGKEPVTLEEQPEEENQEKDEVIDAVPGYYFTLGFALKLRSYSLLHCHL